MGDEVYHTVVKGGLKLKGAAPVAGKKQKKPATASAKLQEAVNNEASSTEPVRIVKITKTPAEIAFEETLRKRQEKRIEKIASKSHKEKVEEFNNYLEKMSEHHDIPRVGPG